MSDHGGLIYFGHAVGYVCEIDALICGCVTHRLGSGRHAPDDDIDYTTGLKLLVSVGSRVSKGKSQSHYSISSSSCSCFFFFFLLLLLVIIIIIIILIIIKYIYIPVVLLQVFIQFIKGKGKGGPYSEGE